MLSHKCFLPILALCFLMHEVYSFLLPDRLQLIRTSHRLGRDLSPHLSELSDLVELIPENGGEMTRDWEPNPARSSAPLPSPAERVSTPHASTQHHRNKDKRLRVTVPWTALVAYTCQAERAERMNRRSNESNPTALTQIHVP